MQRRVTLRTLLVKPAPLVGALLFGGAVYWAGMLSPSALNRQLIRAVLDETSEPQVIEALLRRGANPNLYCLPPQSWDIKELVSGWLVGQPRRGEEGVPLLIRAGWSGQGEVVESLLAHGANPNLTYANGMTPLMAAVSNEDGTLAATLLSHGADPNLRTTSGMTALSLAKEVKRPKLIALLLKAGAKLSLSDGVTE